MSTAFTSDECGLLARALAKARAQMPDAGEDQEPAKVALLSRLLLTAAETGVRDEAELVAYALSRSITSDL